MTEQPEVGTPGREARVLKRIEDFRRKRPRFDAEHITSAHGAGGRAQAALLDAVFLDAYGNDELGRLADAALLDVGDGKTLVFSTDSFVVTPHFFPGGSIGRLAICGTVNDVAMMGGRPSWLSVAYVIEEGFPTDALRAVSADVASAAGEAAIRIVAGDTKVVEHGKGDGLYMTTAGIGVREGDRHPKPEDIEPGDRLICSGTLGDHGIAVMVARGNLALEAEIESDCAPLWPLVDSLLDSAPGTRWMRDPTRGGLATACNELAQSSDSGILLDEAALPVRPDVRAACELLGIDPLYVANEGKIVAVVPADEADAALAAWHAHPLGADAAVVGEVTADPGAGVALATPFGGTRVVDMLVGDPLPRIC